MVQCDKMTTVYRNLETGAYFVQPYTVGPVAATEFGDPTTIQTSEFEAKIADAIMENLDKFGREQYDKVRANLRNDQEQREFMKNHVGVGVSERKGGGLIIHSLHREGGGMVGSHEDTFELSEGEISQKLAPTIAEAFQRAT